MKEIIEECLNQAFEEFGIDAKGKESDIAFQIESTIRLCEPNPNMATHHKAGKLPTEGEIISFIKSLRNCRYCNGSGNAEYAEHGCYISCSHCYGTGKNLKI